VSASPSEVLASVTVGPIADADIPDVIALWQACELTRPWNDPAGDIALARQSPNATILVARDGERIVATAMVGHDGHRGWVYYVAVDPERRQQGFGRAIMSAVENWLRQANIAKLQLMVRPENTSVQAFYESIGYGEQERVVYAKWLDGRESTP
jgi:ribosomal protein S18 acetylase RimI-like enzyme